MNTWVERLGWTLLHSLWQGAVVWAGFQLVLALLRRRSARARYVAACAALTLAMVLPALTFFRLDLNARMSVRKTAASTTAVVPREDSAAASAPAIDTSLPPPTLLPPPAIRSDWLRRLLSWIVFAWAAGCVFCAARLGADWMSVRRLTCAPRSPVPDWLQQLFDRLCERTPARRKPTLIVSYFVDIPSVIGWWRPVILVPASALVGLSPLQFEAVLAHELAHIRRHDLLVNLVQAISEIIFYYHPGIRAINRCIRLEREHVCDDEAVAVIGDPVGYARTLATLEENRAAEKAQPVLAVASNGSDLLSRIRRLLGVEIGPTAGSVHIARTALIAVAGYVLLLVAAPILTAKIMTARERIAAIRRAVPKSWEERLPSPEQADMHAKPEEHTAEWMKRYTGPTMHIRGELRGPDGKLLDIDTILRAEIRREHWGVSTALQVEHGRFSELVPAGEVKIIDWPEGFTPIASGSYLVVPGTSDVPPITLTLKRGFTTRLRFVDPMGRPIPGVHVTGNVRPANTQAWDGTQIEFPRSISDRNGEVAILHVETGTELRLKARTAGYQMADRSIRVQEANAVVDWVMTPATPTPGVVVDRETGAPISGAQISLAAYHGGLPDGSVANPDNIPPENVLAVTDNAGRFTIDDLNPNWVYRVYIQAPQHGFACLPLRAATTSTIQLRKGVRVAGHVRGLGTERAEIECVDHLEVFIDRRAERRESRQPLSGDGPDRAFAFSNVPLGPVTFTVISATGHRTSYPVTIRSDREDLAINVAAASRESTTGPRPVTIAFEPAANLPPPTGTIELAYTGLIGPGFGQAPEPAPHQEVVPVRKGESVIQAYPGPLDVRPAGMIGYWFAPTRLTVLSGHDPVRFDLPVVPAGAIRGRILEDTGGQDDGTVIDCAVVKYPPGVRGSIGVSGRLENRTGTTLSYSVTPLPLGGTYRIIACSGCNFSVSDPIELDSEHPLATIDVRRRRGTDVHGMVVTEDGTPVSVSLLNLGFGDTTVLVPVDANGRFVLRNLNFDVPGTYRLAASEGQLLGAVQLTRNTAVPVVLVVKRPHAP